MPWLLALFISFWNKSGSPVVTRPVVTSRTVFLPGSELSWLIKVAILSVSCMPEILAKSLRSRTSSPRTRFAARLLETSAPTITLLLISPPVVSTVTVAECVAAFTWAFTVTMFGLAVSRAAVALEKSIPPPPVKLEASSSSRFLVNSCTGIKVSLMLKIPI